MNPSLARLRSFLHLAVLALLLAGLTAALAMPAFADASPPGVDSADGVLAQADGADTGARSAPIVEILPLRGGFVDPPVVAQVEDVLDLAVEQNSELVVLQYSSPGGVSVDIDAVIERIQSSPIPVAVLVGPAGNRSNAAGAAGLLWAAADIRAVSPDASVGPLDPADLTDRDGSYPTGQVIADLVADAGADPALAEQLLTDSVPAADLEEAGLVSLNVTGLEPLLLELDGTTVATASGERQLEIRPDEVEVRFHSLGLVRRVLHAATTAPFIYLLLVVGLGMLLFEVFQPGFGVAGIAGIITVGISLFGLWVLPVTWWAVALVVLGLILYAVDTAIAGFGPVTLAATASFAAGSWWFYAAPALQLPWLLVVVTTLIALIFFVFVMTSILRAQAGPEGVQVDELVGRPGIVRSVLNPEGHVYIDGALWWARWTGETRRAKVGTPVRVHAVDGPVVLVEPFDPKPGESADGASEAGTTASDAGASPAGRADR